MRTLTLAALLSVTSLVAQAADPRQFSDHRSLNADARLSVRNVAGSIEVLAWDKPEFDLVASLGDAADKVEISGSSGDLKVEVKNHRSSFSYGDGETRLKLRVPAGVALTVEATSADVIVRGTSGPVTARSVSGDVNLDVGARTVTVQTVSGDVQLAVPAARETRLNTVSGDADVKGAAGSLVAESVSGDVSIEGGVFTAVDLKSVSGNIGLQGGFAAEARVKAESLSGDVRINAPASLSAEVTLKTFSGDKHSDFDAGQKTSDSKRLVLKIGDGRGQFALTSFSGDVTLDRQ